jgi:hypothetical protein
MKMIFRFIFAAIALLTSNACVKDALPVTGTGENALKSLPDAFNAPQDVYELTNTIVNTAAWVVHQASIRNGAVVYHGTLRAVGNDWSYEDHPTDRLEYIPKNSGPVEFFFLKTEGDWSGDDVRFLRNNHRFDFRVKSQVYLDFAISSIQNGLQRSIKTSGPVNMAGKNYLVNVLLEGTYKFDEDDAASKLEVDARYTGNIEGRDFKELIDEEWTFSSLYTSGKYVAESVSRRFENQWTVGERQFKFRNGYIQSAFRDGKPAGWDVGNTPWKARGELLIDDRTYGNLMLEKDDSHLRVWLQSDGQRTEMTNWRL